MDNKDIKRKKFSGNIDEELLKKLKIKAIEEDVTMTDLLEKIIREYLEIPEKKKK